MNKVELLKKMVELEEGKSTINKLLSSTTNFYLEEVKISAELETRDFNNRYNGESFKVDSKLFSEYLKKEIESIDETIKNLLEQLTKY